MDAAAINWTPLVIDHLNPSFLNFELIGTWPGFTVLRHVCRPNQTGVPQLACSYPAWETSSGFFYLFSIRNGESDLS